jgi:hypothetical protein
MDNEWRITEHTPSVAASFASVWAAAAAAQARRIEHPENPRERVPDGFLQVAVLHHELRAAEMARQGMRSRDAKRAVTQAINTFLRRIVVDHSPDLNDDAALRLARNVLEHFDKYYCGIGDRQKTEAKRSGLSREDLAQRYRIDLGGPSAARPHLLVGMKPEQPLVEIDLSESAARAARELADTLGAIAGGQEQV